MNNCLSKKLPHISLGNPPKILLLGNGINRSYGDGSWNNLLDKISCNDYSEKQEIRNLTFPLQAIIMTNDNVDEGVSLVADSLIKSFPGDEWMSLLKQYTEIGFDAILTTNYSFEIEKSLLYAFDCKPGKRCKFRNKTKDGSEAEEQFRIFQYYKLENSNNVNRIWHIHGDASKTNSMILGHYYYGKLLACIENYISHDFIKRYKGIINHGGTFNPLSWIDYFMISDIYIVGYGLDPSELDLWWLLNCKKRHAKELQSGDVYWFEPNLQCKSSFARRKLAEANNLQIITKNINKTGYRDYYSSLPEIIKEYINPK